MKTMSLFSLKTWSIILLIAIVVLVKEDIRKNGAFEESSTGRFLQDVHLYKHAFVFYHWADGTVKQTKHTLRNVSPDYYDTTAEAIEPIASTMYDYANSTIHSAKKWCYIVTHQHTRTYLPIVKDNILYYNQVLKDFLKGIKPNVIWFLCESDTSKYIQEKLSLLWTPIHKFVEETFSINIDLAQIWMDIKSLFKSFNDYSSDLYEKMMDKLNLERDSSV